MRTAVLLTLVLFVPVFAHAAVLLYPNGDVATTYPPVSNEQPSSTASSYKEVQAVEPISSTRTNVQSHEEAVEAPAAATELAAAGATLPAPPKTGGLLHSPWTFGLLGIIAVAGGAFILL